MNVKAVFGQTMGLVILALAAGTISNVTASSKRALQWVGSMELVVPLPVAEETPDPGGASEVPVVDPAEPEIEISTERAISLHQEGALFLDARRSELFYEGHVPGAREYAVWEAHVDDKVLMLMGEFSPEAPVVTYCTGGKCEDSHLLRNKLLAAGYTNVFVFLDGMPGWEEAGQPVEQ